MIPSHVFKLHKSKCSMNTAGGSTHAALSGLDVVVAAAGNNSSGDGGGGGGVGGREETHDGGDAEWRLNCNRMLQLLDVELDCDVFSHARAGHFVVSTYILSPDLTSILLVPTNLNPCGAALPPPRAINEQHQEHQEHQEHDPQHQHDQLHEQDHGKYGSKSTKRALPTAITPSLTRAPVAPLPTTMHVPTVHVNPPDISTLAAAYRAAIELAEVEVDINQTSAAGAGVNMNPDWISLEPFHLSVEQEQAAGEGCLHYRLHYGLVARSVELKLLPPPRESAAVRKKQKNKKRKKNTTTTNQSSNGVDADAAADSTSGAVLRAVVGGATGGGGGGDDDSADQSGNGATERMIATCWHPLCGLTVEAGFKLSIVRSARALESAIKQRAWRA